MEIELTSEVKKTELDYPKVVIYESHGTIVLLTAEGVGLCLVEGTAISRKSGLIYDNWEMSTCSDLRGSITITITQ